MRPRALDDNALIDFLLLQELIARLRHEGTLNPKP